MVITGWWLALGLSLGLLTGKLCERSRRGILLDIALGTGGAVTSGWLSYELVGAGMIGAELYSLFIAAFCAVMLLWTYHTITGRWRVSSPSEDNISGSLQGVQSAKGDRDT